ncbi:hypothetical protein [Halobacteriovorax sp. HLS]|uniref:hypothetical protein n=1 Tax=Halobacteriovorax sp. HLS TaxID=2234000 RepID=UPI000FD7307D|nr:hypothetical protein [Halobacteriovorax sp. HLS]
MNKDYISFLKEDQMSPPKELSKTLENTIMTELHPTHVNVFFKIFLVQLFVGMITLLICPQYHLSFTSNYEVFHYFHHNFGAIICMLICGAIFMGPSMLFAGLIISRSELNLILKTNGLYFVSLLLISLSVFLLAGADIFMMTSLFWILGALSSSFIGIFCGHYLRSRVEQI